MAGRGGRAWGDVPELLRGVLADGASHQGAPPDPSESTRVEWVPVTDLRKLIDKGQLTDGPSLLGLSLALALAPLTE